MGYVISIVNMKGGVGKTTITVNLATCLAKEYRKRVLIVDLDTQVNATISVIQPLYFTKLRKENRTLRTLIHRQIQPDTSSKLGFQTIVQQDICRIAGLDLLPGDIELYNDFSLSALIVTKAQKSQQNFTETWQAFERCLMSEIFQSLKEQYDFILLDFPPSNHLLTRSSLIASDYYLIPAKAEPLSVVGIGLLEGCIQKLKELNPNIESAQLQKDLSQRNARGNLTLIGIIFTSLGHATNMAEKVKHRLTEEFGKDKIFKTEIPSNVAVAKAIDDCQPVVINEPQSTGAKGFLDLASEFLQKLAAL
ncbi:ParA family protein [Lusitaniella coriacea LEGE 07157]|uniref:ParA family protein n=1 Tax=Lusitaniella coriacea LEGE 07157 TaxID=945747 RepID=A0A8J7DX32_9CYAN|nr:ParA family protein [Lusitaniella coriacea]MBE9116510.1 ParA family protein [Lusitaniella coriacea LEGE 07157]